MIRKLLISITIFTILLTAIFAGGNKEVPEVPAVTSGTQYISPNGDGIQDSATLRFTAKVYVKSKQGYIPEYGIQIFDEADNLVHEVVEKEPSDVNWFFALFRGYDLFELEKEITWNGLDRSGNIVPDGAYDVRLYVLDSSDNRTETEVDTFIVDVTPPEATITPPSDNIFSPNGDGVADVYIIQQEGTEEVEWKGLFSNGAGEDVRAFTWTESAPGDVLWDGTDDQGAKVDDGTYTYTLNSTDRAGNSSEDYVVKDIVLNAATPAIDMSLDHTFFSPNGDGRQDTVTVSTRVQNSEEVVSWTGRILSDSREALVKIGGEGSVPETYVVTGYDDQGRRAPEGFYTISYTVIYENGFSTSAEQRIRLDVTPPSVEIHYDDVFSPNGDGLNDFNDVAIRASEPVSWQGQLLGTRGNVIFEGSGPRIVEQLRWDGRSSSGEILPDGSYFVKGVFTDRAGNQYVQKPLEIRIDNRDVDIAMTTGKVLSPNNDGVEDVLPVVLEPTIDAEIATWRLSFETEAGDAVKSYSGDDELPDTLFWDGSQESGRRAAEGRYTASLRVVYEKGDIVEKRSSSFFLDVTPPRLRLSVSSEPFARTNGALEGEVRVGIEVEDESEIAEWSIDILNSSGEIIRSYAGTGNPAEQITWNGTAGDGTVANPEDSYQVQVSIIDVGGNSSVYTEGLPFDVAIMVKNGKYYILTPNIIFGAYKHALDSAGEAMYKRNQESLDRAAAILQRYPVYDLILEGHALNIYLDGPREDGEEEILGPLTERRAKTVREALIQRGISENRISIEAFGGQQPIVSVSDKTIWWKNRRVEFRLEKE
ncbi:gliding motility-associated C-terminal domain-containing protein [Marispirochaeta sp.]|uniref:T9SS type B sorting domain-containing protein n=1 Tax=Marispirochaeta sp. TaxID=2038653 RepID=UPI0029C88C6D|nr:gliding motility-associated C-terminal domain-containing protein [Marispirochaeta sp.]